VVPISARIGSPGPGRFTTLTAVEAIEASDSDIGIGSPGPGNSHCGPVIPRNLMNILYGGFEVANPVNEIPKFPSEVPTKSLREYNKDTDRSIPNL
jgi:hypothetical protein